MVEVANGGLAELPAGNRGGRELTAGKRDLQACYPISARRVARAVDRAAAPPTSVPIMAPIARPSATVAILAPSGRWC